MSLSVSQQEQINLSVILLDIEVGMIFKKIVIEWSFLVTFHSHLAKITFQGCLILKLFNLFRVCMNCFFFSWFSIVYLSSGVGKVGWGECGYFKKLANFPTVETFKFNKLPIKFIMAYKFYFSLNFLTHDILDVHSSLFESESKSVESVSCKICLAKALKNCKINRI